MMKEKIIILFLAIAVVIGAGIVVAQDRGYKQDFSSMKKEHHKSVCADGTSSDFNCHAKVIVDEKGSPKALTGPAGYGPAQFRGAYNLSGKISSPQTIAIVDAFDHPNILSDLNYYSSVMGIPGLKNCPVASGTPLSSCFQKVNQRGGTKYPALNRSWALEIALDVEVAHAACENCNILLVEADSNSYANLMAAVDRARIMGANVISNSYGSNEFSGETTFDSHFNYPNVAFTFSSGDSGYGTSYPAASKYVTAVGGTTLLVNPDNSYAGEEAWSGAGSGCSLYEAKPLWQTDAACANRTIADVSADADPNTGAAVYDSVKYFGRQGWFKVGGTSLSAPLIAGVYALSGNYAGSANSLPYALGNYAVNLRDVTSGSNGTCTSAYLCKAATNYDGPTGLGTPNGSSAF